MLRFVAIVGLLAPCGCVDPLFEMEECGGAGQPGVVLSHRREPDVIGDGSEIEVFEPPQGGVFTELDVRITGLYPREVHVLELAIESETGVELAFSSYPRERMPLGCEEDDTLSVDNVPLQFTPGSTLGDLNEVDGVLTCTLQTDGGVLTVMHPVLLLTTGYTPPG